MSDEEEQEEYSIYKSETTSIQDGKEVSVSAPSKEDAKELFEEAWNK